MQHGTDSCSKPKGVQRCFSYLDPRSSPWRAPSLGPNEPILTTFGDKRLIAFYVPDSGRCSINAVVFDAASADASNSPARVRISLWPGESFHLDAGQKSVNLRCGDNASAMALSGPAEVINTSATTSVR